MFDNICTQKNTQILLFLSSTPTWPKLFPFQAILSTEAGLFITYFSIIEFKLHCKTLKVLESREKSVRTWCS